MAQFSQSNTPRRLNMDVARKYLQPEEAFYLLNHEVNNASALGKSTPVNANYPACSMQLPAGENYTIGSYYSPITNETYSWVYNSNSVHYIQRITGSGICEVVYSGTCLELSADPAAAITQFRAYLDVDYLCTRIPGGKLKRLVWVDGTDTPIGMIDVEASIATDFFTTPFFDICADECAPLQLCVPEPQGCLTGSFVPAAQADSGLTNNLLDKGLKFMFRHVYYDGRASEYSDRSTLYFQDTKGCFDTAEGYPRCMLFDLPIGNPMVDKIEFAFSENGGVDWFLADTIEKYNPYTSATPYWYQRGLSDAITGSPGYVTGSCTFKYEFCNDKQRTAIDPLAVSRVMNPEPRQVQGLVPVKEELGFYNYVKGNCPLDKNETDKFQVGLDCTDAVACDAKLVTVKVRAIIHNYTHQRNQPIFREGTGVDDDVTDTAKFGGLNAALSGGYEDPIAYDQFFNGEVRNFIAYIEGSSYWQEMKQWHASKNWNERELTGILDNFSEESTRNDVRRDQRHGGFYYQEAIFKVPQGTKGFIRLASHHAEGGTGSWQDTSTFVVAVYADLNSYVGDDTITSSILKEEIYFDTCAGAQDLSEAFIIEDNAVDTGSLDVVTNKAQSFYGYLKDSSGRPVEGAVVYAVGAEAETTTITDHNGFFHSQAQPPFGDGDVNLNIKAETTCGAFATVKTVVWDAESGNSTDMGIVRITDDDDAGYLNNFATVKIKVEDCDGVAVAGIRIALSGSKYESTGTDGFATFEIRNYSTRDRVVRAAVVDHAGCFTLDCNDACNPCFDSPTGAAPVCFEDAAREVTLDTIVINKNPATVNRKGLKNGGRYPFAIAAKGNCGRMSVAYEISPYLEIPKAQVSGKVQYCDLTFDGGGIELPDWATQLVILRGENVNPFELQWVVDKIESTDDGKIKLTIQSLNDYNADHFFKTNTIYQYLKGDRVEFIRNGGEGEMFDTVTKKGLLNYLVLNPFHEVEESGEEDAPADYFNQLLIDDDGRLDDLEEGAVIELQRPKDATKEVTYFETCNSIEVIQVANATGGGTHGELVVSSGIFSTFDTYLVNRAIGTLPAQAFEHHSPSDFWGEKINDTGRVHFKNPYENERRWGRNISLNAAEQFNYFGDFEKTFDAKEQGDIIAVFLKDDKIGIALAENDNFLFQIADDLLRLGKDNVVRAAPADNKISNPEAKLRGEFGCSYQDIGSIFSGDGFLTYISEKNDGYIIHDYSSAKKAGENMTKEGIIMTQCHSYFKKRIREKENANRIAGVNYLDHYRWSTGINKNTGAVLLTLKTLRHAGINNAKEAYELPNDTIMYNPLNDNFLGFASFTAEGYSQLNLNTAGGCAFLAFQNGLPYIHPVIADKYNTFFGVACDWVVGISVNKFIEKIKVPQAIELQSETMWFVSKVTSDKAGFLSEIPPIRFRKTENRWNAAFLNNINSRGGLYNGENARGYNIDVVFVRDNTDGLVYGSVNDLKREIYSELSNIMTKFMTSESAGQTENL